MNPKATRRSFLKASAVLSVPLWGGMTWLSAQNELLGASSSWRAPSIPYENRLQDHLWMWGHDTGVYDGPGNSYNIPVSENITMADSIALMGIPNVCVIRWGEPDDDYLKQFKNVKRLAWVISGNIPHNSYSRLSKFVYPLFDKLPNLTGVYLDDFFRSGKPDQIKTADGTVERAPANMSMEELEDLRQHLLKDQKKREMGLVLYSHQLRPAIKPQIAMADFVSYWIWSGKNINKMEADFQLYRKIVPEKRTLLGIYMWNFGESKPLDSDLMKFQLDYALKLYEKKEIEGLIFHCTPLCNKKIEAVEYAAQWIREHAEVRQ